jgi:NAD/NADP transhydrogenase alpha subunit
LAAAGPGAGWARVFGFFALVLASVNIFGGFLVTQRMLRLYKRKGAGALAVALASVNIFGGFLVTQRMLAMYKKKEKK